MGLFIHDLQVTDYSVDEILIQSLFFHYPEIFRQLKLDLIYPILFNQEEYSKIKYLIEHRDLEFNEFIFKLLSLNIDTVKNTTQRFPGSKILEPIISNNIEFRDFKQSKQYIILIQKLILQYHITVQPEYLLNKTKYYHHIPIVLSYDNAILLLDQIPCYTYSKKKCDQLIRGRIHQRFELTIGQITH